MMVTVTIIAVFKVIHSYGLPGAFVKGGGGESMKIIIGIENLGKNHR